MGNLRKRKTRDGRHSASSSSKLTIIDIHHSTQMREVSANEQAKSKWHWLFFSSGSHEAGKPPRALVAALIRDATNDAQQRVMIFSIRLYRSGASTDRDVERGGINRPISTRPRTVLVRARTYCYLVRSSDGRLIYFLYTHSRTFCPFPFSPT